MKTMKKVLKLSPQQVYDLQLRKLDSEIEQLSFKIGRDSAPSVDDTLKSFLENRDFKTSVPLPPAETGQTVFAKVTYVEDCGDYKQLFIIPEEEVEAADNYNTKLQLKYGDDNKSGIRSADLGKFREHLIVARIEGLWRRCRILSCVPQPILTIGIEDIDSGTKDIQMSANHVFKLPQVEEMTRPAFASRVIVENMSDEEILLGNFIKIRMTHVDPFGVNFAEADEEEVSMERSEDFELTGDFATEPTEQARLRSSPAKPIMSALAALQPASAVKPSFVADETFSPSDETRNVGDETWQSSESPNVTTGSNGAPVKHYYSRKKNHRHISEVKYSKAFLMSSKMEMKELHYGLNVNLFYISGPVNGSMAVSGSSKKDWVDSNKLTFAAMESEIPSYVETQPPFKPQINELCLAKLSSDGSFHRAVCINLRLAEATVLFSDYGLVENVSFDDIVKFSLQFVFPCYVHTVEFILASGRPISSIDSERTRQKLLQIQNFPGQVMNNPEHPGKYKIVLEDKYVAF